MVIAIIAILASLLLPALRQARAVARSVQCSTILRQWHLAASMYADDYNGYYMPICAGDPPWTPWFINPAWEYYYPGGFEAMRENLCPDSLATQAGAGITRSYGMVAGYDVYEEVGWCSWWSGRRFIGWNVDSIEDPSFKMSFADGLDVTLYGSRADRYVAEHPDFARGGRPAYRHPNATMNASFYDGSARRVTRDEATSTRRVWDIFNIHKDYY